jgi:hypothetical protein
MSNTRQTIFIAYHYLNIRYKVRNRTRMDIEQARTFLAIAAHGSFLEAASRLHVTQSTVSARM